MAWLAGRRIIVPDVEACDGMAGTADLDEYRRSDIRAVQSTPLVSRSGQLLGMISTHWREPHQPTEHRLRFLDVLARQAADLIALRESEQRLKQLAAIVESSNDAIIGKDLDGIITSWNKGAERLFGYATDEAVGKPVTLLIPPDRHDEEAMILERIRRDKRIEHYETIRRCEHGGLIDISLTISPIKNAKGNIVGASKIARDITAKKQSEAQIAILAHEAEHRANNILATVQAMIRLSRSDTPDDLKHVIEGRIQSLANVHRLFVESRWTGVDMNGLATQELSPYCQRGDTRVRIDGSDVLLSLKYRSGGGRDPARTGHQRGKVWRPLDTRRACANRLVASCRRTTGALVGRDRRSAGYTADATGLRHARDGRPHPKPIERRHAL